MSAEFPAPETDRWASIPLRLWSPDWNDSLWRTQPKIFGGRTIFCDPSVVIAPDELGREAVEGLTYTHDDSLSERLSDRTINLLSLEEAGCFPERSASLAEYVLRRTLGDDRLWLGHIRTYVAQNGRSFRFYGYRTRGKLSES